MLLAGVIRPSVSPYASQVLFQQKSDGTWRLCVDYRKLNSQTVRMATPLPKPRDIMAKLGGSTVFTALDLASGYWQIGVNPKDRHKTAFVTPWGLYEFNVMPFGLTNAPAIFQGAMDSLFKGLKFASAYMDEIIVFSKTREDHLRHLQKTLQILREAGFRAKASKCPWFQTTVRYVGHLISAEGVTAIPESAALVLQ